MALATGVAKQLRYKVESTYGTAPGASGAQLLRRVTSDISLNKDTYESGEIRSDYQVANFRHGVRRVGGSIKGELSPGTYKDFIAAALRRDFAAVSAIASLSLTIAASGSNYTITRATGSWLTDGVKVGDVVRITAGSVNANNLSKNVLVLSLTATVITGYVLNGLTMTAEGPIASCTLTVVGKKTYVPTSGHTDKSFAFEHWFSDIAQSELFTGCKIGSIAVDLPPTGMATLDMGVLGQNQTNATSQYYTSPTAASSTGVVAAVNGALMAGGNLIAICTGLNFTIDGGYSGDPVVGSNTIPNQFPGRVKVSGQFTAYFQDATLRDNFINEDEISLVVVMTTTSAKDADFIGFTLPRIKLGSASKSDGEQGIVQTFAFTALYNANGGAGTSGEQSTIVVQDSQA
jgi:hypothetical protein